MSADPASAETPSASPSRSSFDLGALSMPLAIALAIAGQLTILRRPEAAIGPGLYLAAIAILVLGSFGKGAAATPWDDERPTRDGVAMALLMVLAAVLRLALVDTHPGVFGDEGERGMEARGILLGARPPLAGYGWWGVPNVYFYLVSFCLRLAGDNLAGLRLLSVVSGVFAVFFVARTARLLWGSRAGLLAGLLLAVSPVALQFSRLAGESTPMGALWAGGFFFVLRALRYGLRRDALAAGFCLGASLYFYAAAKLVLLLVPALAICLLAVRPRPRTPALVAWLLAAFAATALPIGVRSFKERDGFGGRYGETSIFSPQNRPIAFAEARVPYRAEWDAESTPATVAKHPVSWARVLAHQVKTTIDVLYRNGEPTVFYQPEAHLGTILSPLVAALALLGLVWGIRNVRDVRFAIVCLWFWGGLLAPILTINTPSVQRMAGAWPALMLFPAALLESAARRLSRVGARRAATAALVGLAGTIAVLDTREYFVGYRALAPYGDATAQARHVASLQDGYRLYGLGIEGTRVGDVLFGYGPTRFLAARAEGDDVTALPSRLPVLDDGGKGLAFLVYPSNAVFLPMLRLFYPDGKEEVVTVAGRPCFTSYRVEPKAVAGARLLKASFTMPNGERLERGETSLGTIGHRGTADSWTPPPSLLYPARASWEGAFLLGRDGPTKLALRGGGDAELTVDGEVVQREVGRPGSAAGAELVLARGLHAVRLAGTLATDESRIVVTLAAPGETPQPLEGRRLFREAFGGLSGEIWTGGSVEVLPERAPDSRRVDPFVGFRDLHADPAFLKEPFSARWRGALRVPRAGEHTLWLRSNGPGRLFVDGKPLIAIAARGEAAAKIELDARPHDLELRYAWSSDRPYLELTWTPPGGETGFIPPALLSPAFRSGPVVR